MRATAVTAAGENVALCCGDPWAVVQFSPAAAGGAEGGSGALSLASIACQDSVERLETWWSPEPEENLNGSPRPFSPFLSPFLSPFSPFPRVLGTPGELGRLLRVRCWQRSVRNMDGWSILTDDTDGCCVAMQASTTPPAVVCIARPWSSKPTPRWERRGRHCCPLTQKPPAFRWWSTAAPCSCCRRAR